ncbi:MAG TPA: hypothetical protein PLD25_14550 [Chloroflexota bacterium]|nr:hypothetical protein [Chloroflexota bacterium]
MSILSWKGHEAVNLNNITVSVSASLVAGLAAGVMARFSMRAIALAAGLTPGFSVGGTMAILLLGMVMGIPFGLLFLVLSRWAPLSRRWLGALYGLVLLLVFLVPAFFLTEPGGELALVSPLTGFLLFAPVPLVYGVTLGVMTEWLHGRTHTSAPHAVHIGWLLLFGGTAVLLFLNAANLMSVSLPLPAAVNDLIRHQQWSFTNAHNVHTGLTAVILLLYILLLWLVFWQAEQWMARFTAVTLLLFAAAFFNTGALFTGLVRMHGPAIYLPGLMRVVGLVAFAWLWCWFPDGKFVPGWARPFLIVTALWAGLWFLAPVWWPSWVQVGLGTAVFLMLLVAQFKRYQSATNAQQEATRPVVWTLDGLLIGFCLLWMFVLLFPEWRARVSPRLVMHTAFAFGPYLLLWLLLPSVLVWAVWRKGLWRS